MTFPLLNRMAARIGQYRSAWVRPCACLLAVCVASMAPAAGAQSAARAATPNRSFGGGNWFDVPEQDGVVHSEVFTFCRVRYFSPKRGNWAIDYPQSDLNFSQRLAELTTIKVSSNPDGSVRHDVVWLTDENIGDYPYIYLVEPGYLTLLDGEAEALRDYLERGGFLHVDDFWGEREWENWVFEIRKVFPDEEAWPIVDIPLEHPLFNCVFRLTEIPQVPALGIWARTGVSYERYDAQEPHVRGIFDGDGRLMIVMTHNTDLGDGWEREGENAEYFREFSAKRAYPMGINIVVYAMTH